MQPKISIVVPVYNVEKYIRECLDSLVNQTLEDIEIICVNDGSRDSSPQILEEYASKDSRIRVFHQENQGVSAARNFGIKNVTGEYLTFVDSDDWIELNALEILYKTVKERKSDILLFSHYNFINNVIYKDLRLDNIAQIAMDKNIKFDEYYQEFFKLPLGVCGRLYSTNLIKNNNILFPLNVQCSEDWLFAIEAFINAKAIGILNTGLCYYRKNSEQSLSKNSTNGITHTYKMSKIYKDILYSSDNLENKDDIYHTSLNSIIKLILWHFNNIHGMNAKKKNIKYIKKIKKEYKPYSKKNEESMAMYKKLENTIKNYNRLYIKKLMEPIFEIEPRTNRLAIYLFEKQILNINLNQFIRKELQFRYMKNLLKLKLKIKFKKIRVFFLVTDVAKWTCQSFYNELKNSKFFEPIICISLYNNKASKISLLQVYEDGIKYFKEHSMKFIKLYDIEKEEYLSIKDFKPDIIFYQQPWGLIDNQSILNTSKYALTCYIPYCFYSMDGKHNYLKYFHERLWKYFVETSYHKQKYEQDYSCANCYVSGSPKLDNYQLIDKEKILNTKSSKKRIIYAPHHSFEIGVDNAVATFKENGKFILELAKKHPETEWIFRPHPVFADRLLLYNIMTKEEIIQYYSEWEKIGIISKNTDNYYEQFLSSDCLITDCISFLSEYLPTGKPVIHLRRKEQRFPFLYILEKITETYYQSHNNEELSNYFEEVVIKGKDYLKEKRHEALKYLIFEENQNAGRNIRKYLEYTLGVK